MNKSILIISVESQENLSTINCCTFDCNKRRITQCNSLTRGAKATIPYSDINSCLHDQNGNKLIDNMYFKIIKQQENCKKKCDCISISLPGIIKNNKEIITSSRLGIRNEIAAAKILEEKLRLPNLPIFIFHDTESLLTGEIMALPSILSDDSSPLVYIFVDEGIGCKIMIDGKFYIGNGTAGALSRFIVQPDGVYFPDLKAFGSLEVYASRPWISRKLVEAFHSEKGKSRFQKRNKEEKKEEFRNTLESLANKDTKEWSKVRYNHINLGLQYRDPIALRVIDNAARYLGLAISNIIALINPKTILLGGSMITEVSAFATASINYARQFSWPTPWNNTNIHISTLSRSRAQIHGTAKLSMEKIAPE